jgi:hypothetical protein
VLTLRDSARCSTATSVLDKSPLGGCSLAGRLNATRQIGLDRESTGAFEVCPDVPAAIASLAGDGPRHGRSP